MFKILFNIVLIFVGLGTSVHANDFELLTSDFEHTISLEASGEVNELSTSHQLFFDVQTEDYSVVSNSETEPAPPSEISENTDQLLSRSNYFSALQRTQFINAERNSCAYFFLSKILFPFHSFW